MWSTTIKQGTDSHLRKFFFLHWFNIHLSPKPSYGVGRSSLTSFKLSPSSNVCQIWSQNSLSTSLRTWNMALSEGQYWSIRKEIKQFSWDRSFKNLDVNEMVFLFNRTIKKILSNYIPHEIIVCDDRDPSWINNRVKELINEKNDTFQCYLHSNK